MKKLANALSLLLCSAITLQAQVEKGKVLLGASLPITGGLESILVPTARGGGGAGLSFSTLEGEGEGKAKTTTFGFSPVIGYAVADNLLLSVGFNVFSSKTKDAEDNSDEVLKLSNFSVEPQVRYYLPGAKVRPFLEAGASFGTMKEEYSGSGSFFDYEDKVNHNAFRGGAGVALFFSRSASIDFLVNYQHATWKPDDSDEGKLTGNAFGLNVGFSWFLK